ncbi:hypothetical protein NONO_c60280 [Nocardia nova SH22a]|uniref:Uncharacterized protein n=1 Tax=Nocardia nova SH22a TaxID=1415166 RepID=W5TNR4_9NOCA|nr:hypothetical protein [Nocardia nova]AHH20804.1 hypothetical protein NONO_c60280 [Nocardia nova SH22a]
MTNDQPTRENTGVSFYIAAADIADARALFELCVQKAETGERFEGNLVRASEDGGAAQVYTRLRRTRRRREVTDGQ